MERVDGIKIVEDIRAVLGEKKAADVVAFDVSNLTSFTDYIVIATVNSQTQMKAVLRELKESLKYGHYHTEGAPASGWVLVDYGAVVLNLFTPDIREFYRLERLWGDARKVE